MAKGMETVLITGAAGEIGRTLKPLLKPHYKQLILSDIVVPNELGAGERFERADISEMKDVERICEGVDGILHLGGRSTEDRWDVILPNNLIGCYNIFEAARRKGVKRVIFASSNHAIGFYRRRRKIGVDERVRPDSRYGVSKAYGEAMGSLYADKYGLGVMSIRIGNFGVKPIDKRRMSIWISPRDLTQLVRIGLEHPEMRNEVVYGASDNERGWWDNEPAYRLGYKPEDRAEDFRDDALAAEAKLPRDPLGDQFHGGTFCSDGYAGDPERVR
jgi:uronate dehydrogenase